MVRVPSPIDMRAPKQYQENHAEEETIIIQYSRRIEAEVTKKLS